MSANVHKDMKWTPTQESAGKLQVGWLKLHKDSIPNNAILGIYFLGKDTMYSKGYKVQGSFFFLQPK